MPIPPPCIAQLVERRTVALKEYSHGSSGRRSDLAPFPVGKKGRENHRRPGSRDRSRVRSRALNPGSGPIDRYPTPGSQSG
eukprot:scaffold416_cov329-Pavlova_lutheri.AAC.18